MQLLTRYLPLLWWRTRTCCWRLAVGTLLQRLAISVWAQTGHQSQDRSKARWKIKPLSLCCESFECAHLESFPRRNSSSVHNHLLSSPSFSWHKRSFGQWLQRDFCPILCHVLSPWVTDLLRGHTNAVEILVFRLSHDILMVSQSSLDSVQFSFHIAAASDMLSLLFRWMGHFTCDGLALFYSKCMSAVHLITLKMMHPISTREFNILPFFKRQTFCYKQPFQRDGRYFSKGLDWWFLREGHRRVCCQTTQAWSISRWQANRQDSPLALSWCQAVSSLFDELLPHTFSCMRLHHTGYGHESVQKSTMIKKTEISRSWKKHTALRRQRRTRKCSRKRV